MILLIADRSDTQLPGLTLQCLSEAWFFSPLMSCSEMLSSRNTRGRFRSRNFRSTERSLSLVIKARGTSILILTCADSEAIRPQRVAGSISM